jgi:hypothetical protein
MKFSQFKLVLVFVVIGFMFFSCSSSSDDAVDANTDEFITASVETISFTSASRPEAVTAVKIETATTTLIIQGVSDVPSAMVLIINDYEGLGTYDLSFTEDSDGTSGLYSSGNSAWSSNGGEGGTGSITINSDNDTETTGTFEFVGVDEQGTSRTVTNGRFRAIFEEL